MKGSENLFSEKKKDLCAENEGISLSQISMFYKFNLTFFHCNFNFKMVKYTQVS